MNACTAFSPKDRPSSKAAMEYLEALLATRLTTVLE